MAEFLILMGGPGVFFSCDPKHDKAWLNYFYPMKVAAEEDLYKKSQETVHWLVYEPAYKGRWLDDDEITLLQKVSEVFPSGRKALHEARKAQADRISPAKNYLDYIQGVAKKQSITYHGITDPSGFWDTIGACSPNSISRVWYCGHCTRGGLILVLQHNKDCVAVWDKSSTVETSTVEKNSALKDRFVKGTKVSSQFYGCHSSDFAQAWTSTFGVPSEGATKSITFRDVVTSTREEILEDMKTESTPEGPPGWTKFEPN